MCAECLYSLPSFRLHLRRYFAVLAVVVLLSGMQALSGLFSTVYVLRAVQLCFLLSGELLAVVCVRVWWRYCAGLFAAFAGCTACSAYFCSRSMLLRVLLARLATVSACVFFFAALAAHYVLLMYCWLHCACAFARSMCAIGLGCCMLLHCCAPCTLHMHYAIFLPSCRVLAVYAACFCASYALHCCAPLRHMHVSFALCYIPFAGCLLRVLLLHCCVVACFCACYALFTAAPFQ